LKALLPILLPALDRNDDLKLDDAIHSKVVWMSAGTIDRSLRQSKNVTRPRKHARLVLEPRRRIKMRTFRILLSHGIELTHSRP
jgi:hypothetical protein